MIAKMTLFTPASKKKVALLIETSNGYGRGLISGVVSAAHQFADWSIFLPEQERGAPPPHWLSSWKGDGIIARIDTPEIAITVAKMNLPTVDLSAALLSHNMPWVETNDVAIARMGANHLLECGFGEFAFCGDPHFNCSNWRFQEFQRVILASGHKTHFYNSIPKRHPQYNWSRDREQLANWLASLPKPIGMMACHDSLARQILDVCQDLKIEVPEQIALVGVDNDPLICELCEPSLTSIVTNSFRAGYVAAELLNRMMAGEVVSPDPVFIDPIGIEIRKSTDILAVQDPQIVEALRFIRDKSSANIRVSDIVNHLDISRRKLEKRFLELVGRTPHQEIQRRRIEKVKHLLRFSNLPLSEIARHSGYEHPEYLCVAFQRETGKTTSEFREEHGRV